MRSSFSLREYCFRRHSSWCEWQLDGKYALCKIHLFLNNQKQKYACAFPAWVSFYMAVMRSTLYIVAKGHGFLCFKIIYPKTKFEMKLFNFLLSFISNRACSHSVRVVNARNVTNLHTHCVVSRYVIHLDHQMFLKNVIW